MILVMFLIGALTCLVSAAPWIHQRDDKSTSQKSTLTYTATRTVQITSTITGNATVATPYTIIKPFTLPYGSPVYTDTITCRSQNRSLELRC